MRHADVTRLHASSVLALSRARQLITNVDEGSATDGGDRITALNLTRAIQPDELPPQMRRLAEKLAEETELPGAETDEAMDGAETDVSAAAAAVTITTEHYVGGP